jgi:glycosyltransferase involved in cell wall biosynthesis
MAKFLQIGNYPPPACGWAVQTKLLVEELRRRGHVCEVLNINENRRVKSPEYVDVQNGFDYFAKLCRFAARGYRFQVHVNGQSKPGYALALLAALVGRLSGRPAFIGWRGGLDQKYFPRQDNRWLRWAYRRLFALAGGISCNSKPIKQAIEDYGIDPQKVVAIPAFSRQHVNFEPAALTPEIESFLQSHRNVFFCYVSFRPEYQLDMLREAMRNFRRDHPDAGFVWLGFPAKEMPAVQQFLHSWSPSEREGLLLLGNLPHPEFLTLLARCFAYIRTPMCDGVSSSILESLSLGVPVVASDNGSRPAAVVTYREGGQADLCAKLDLVIAQYEKIKAQSRLEVAADNIALTVDWLLGETTAQPVESAVELAHVR